MDLDIKNETIQEKQNDEVTDFINELTDTLDKNNELTPINNLFNEILEDVELASKYQSILQSTIDKCLKDLSYERDFYYFDYDKNEKEYSLKYYYKGGTAKCNNFDIEQCKKAGFMFYIPADDNGTIAATNSLKDWIKCEVDSALLKIDIEKRDNIKGN